MYIGFGSDGLFIASLICEEFKVLYLQVFLRTGLGGPPAKLVF